MKSLIRNTLFYSLALYLIAAYIPGVKFTAGFELLIAAGAALTILVIFVRPILKILFLPINLLTLGIFSGLINVILLYLLTRFFDPLTISDWNFAGFNYQGFLIPKMHFSTFWTYFLVSAIISLGASIINWLCD